MPASKGVRPRVHEKPSLDGDAGCRRCPGLLAMDGRDLPDRLALSPPTAERARSPGPLAAPRGREYDRRLAAP
jgi:hypothetical protein